MVVAGNDLQRGDIGVEKRRHVRVEAELEVSFSFAGDGARLPGRAVTRDISHGGACLAVFGCTAELLGKFAGLPLLDVAIDSAGVGSIQARVEWVRPPSPPGATALIGLEFRNVRASDEMAIIDLIAHIVIGNRATRPPEAARSGECQPVCSG